MDSPRVSIITHDGKENWETTLIRGVLQSYDIPSVILSNGSLSAIAHADVCVVLGTLSSVWKRLLPNKKIRKISKNIILAGRAVTYGYLKKKIAPVEREILICGEPYASIVFLARKKELLDEIKGKVVLGPLLDLEKYRMPFPLVGRDRKPALLLTSLGCNKRCGYCSYGTTFSKLYGKEFSRRSRSRKAVARDMITSIVNGIDEFRAVADQFLALKKEENSELRMLTCAWRRLSDRRPRLSFTIAPRELLENKELIGAMDQCFELVPSLSIENLDDRALELFDLGFDAATALEAAEFLSSRKIPFRINYIFVRPGATMEGMRAEFANLASLASMTSFMTPHQQLLLSEDIFSGELRIMPCSPLAERREARKPIPEKMKQRFVDLISMVREESDKARKSLEKEVSDNPFFSIITSAQKEVMRWKI